MEASRFSDLLGCLSVAVRRLLRALRAYPRLKDRLPKQAAAKQA